MQLVEQHVIDRKDPRYAIIDAAAFKSKNLYNAALYEMRQAFIRSGIYLSYEEMYTCMQPSDKERALARRKLRRLNGGSEAFLALTLVKRAYRTSI